MNIYNCVNTSFTHAYLINIVHDRVVGFIESFQLAESIVQVLFLGASTFIQLGELFADTFHL